MTDIAKTGSAEGMGATLAALRLEELVQGLRDPACYPHPAGAVEVLETHISFVLLAGEFAYKLKKPVRFGFLDFSTLAARRFYCEEEVRLNRRTAAELYLGVVTIGGRLPRPQVGGAEPVLEYAVRMRRFPQEALYDHMARCATLEPWHVDALAERVARFHAGIERSGVGELGSVGDVLVPALANLDDLAKVDRSPRLPEEISKLRAWTLAEHRECSGHFALRKSGGFVRECHGDLHLGNVALLGNAAVPFDCIEFDERYRWIDVMSDVAFTVMDLAHHGLPRLAARFLNRYLEESGDYAGLAVLRFYLVYRALVRAKICVIRGQWAAFDGYLQLALRLSVRTAPVLVAMHGLSGSGKTTTSQGLLEALGAIRVRSDIERKRAHGLQPLSRADAGIGEGLYTAAETQRTYARLAMLAGEVLGAGFPVVVDAACLRRWQRDALREAAGGARAAFGIASCAAPEPLLRERVGRRAAQARDASDAGIAVLESQLALLEPLGDDERTHALFLDSASEIEWPGAIESFARRLGERAE